MIAWYWFVIGLVLSASLAVVVMGAICSGARADAERRAYEDGLRDGYENGLREARGEVA